MKNLLNKIKNGIVTSRVWQSIFRHGVPDNDIDRSLVITNNALLHLHPVKVRKSGLKFTYTMGLGGLSLFLFLVLAVTGAMLMFHYVPSVERAYNDIVRIQSAVPFGALLRNIHRWSAELLVISVFLHLCRVFFTGAYKMPRSFNWVLGLGLLFFTLAASYTGYLLPWDQLAYWAATVGSNIASYVPFIGDFLKTMLLGGSEVGQATLTRFYNLHVMIIPVGMIIIMSIHFWRIRKDGGISAPIETGQEPETMKAGEPGTVQPRNTEKTYGLMALAQGSPRMAEKKPEDTVMTFPHLVILEVLAALTMTALLLVLSVLRDAPLEETANPEMAPAVAKAAWYLMGIQELILHMHPTLGAIIIPSLVIISLLALPYIDFKQNGVGIWFYSKRGKSIALVSALGTLIAVPALIALDSLIGVRGVWPEIPVFLAGVVIPLVSIAFLIAVIYFILRRIRASTREIVIAYFTVFIVSLVVLTLVMMFFRGPGMALYWPWNMPSSH